MFDKKWSLLRVLPQALGRSVVFSPPEAVNAVCFRSLYQEDKPAPTSNDEIPAGTSTGSPTDPRKERLQCQSSVSHDAAAQCIGCPSLHSQPTSLPLLLLPCFSLLVAVSNDAAIPPREGVRLVALIRPFDPLFLFFCLFCLPLFT